MTDGLVDEGITFTDRFEDMIARFDAIETVLAIQRKRLEDIEDSLTAVKKAIGIVILGLSGQPVNVGPDLMERLGFKTSSIVPASVITKAS